MTTTLTIYDEVTLQTERNDYPQRIACSQSGRASVRLQSLKLLIKIDHVSAL